MTLQRNHYEVLGVSPTATTDQIKKKYRELARKFHPDVVKDKALGQKVFTQINQAYRILADPERRAQYDATLRSERAQAKTTGPISAGTNGAAPSNGAAPQANAPLNAQQTLALNRLLGDADFALMNRDAKAAREHSEAALKMDPRNARGLGLLGDARAALGQRDEAIAAYKQSLQIAPSALIQASLSRLENGPVLSRPNGAGANPGTRTMPPNGASSGARAPSTGSSGTDKVAGGLFGRLLGKKK